MTKHVHNTWSQRQPTREHRPHIFPLIDDKLPAKSYKHNTTQAPLVLLIHIYISILYCTSSNKYYHINYMAVEGNESRRPHVVLLPTPGMGHVIPLADFAVRLAAAHSFSATLLTFSNFNSPAQAAFLASLPSDSVTSVSLPSISLSDLPPDSPIEVHLCALLTRCLPLLRDAFLSFRNPAAAFVCDLFGSVTLSLVRELGVPGYIFYPTNLRMLTLALHLPRLDETTDVDFEDLPDPVCLPGCVAIRGTDFPDPLRKKSHPAYAPLIRIMSSDAAGILVNSFEEMEKEVLKAIREEEQAEAGRPPVHLVGPMVRSGSDEADESGCLEWLDRQPADSVLFVSFGSGGSLSTEQMQEMALGLEASGQRFLWVVRCPSDKEKNAAFFTSGSKDDPSNYLPEGFLERTKDVGRVVSSWAPQVKVLAHAATGGFFSHCGWNSALESTVHGVPMIAHPLYAEQHWNAVLLTEAVGIAIRPRSRDPYGVVGREEIAAAVKELMQGEKGKALRCRTKELQEAAARALAPPDGSSYKALQGVANKWKEGASLRVAST
ncbi:hydroquinone glucosyltransferase-like isoform X2 [Ananas comosus]|uniref:Hydroquinone glucosyltransferase-like isoform X2 n=1 Tax=Ananas comosus TaxID=4615 RepID=A0A6P5GAZ4_ANACO|nr:hydroquinone glucosyltransferase-like isoform X2 [Ananas comosus]